ncbi:MAG TPA: short-chain dehydrogenase [Dehalococcoidia bacterium]|nr:short-chain dehydrogenase [Chloroflexota bacterium]HCL26188.1 short-chain dehydrogenase [Dehalococcoidia bacterium]
MSSDGPTAGIGRVTTLELARVGANVVIAGRNPAKCAVTAIEIREETRNPFIEYLVADLSSQYQVRGLADEFKARHHQLDVLVINAGALYMSRQYSADKIEMTFALNHLSYFLLTNLLLDTLVDSPSARVVNVASSAHQEARLELADIHDPHRYFGFRAYSRSKLCNVLFTYELVRRLQETEVTVNALHPGLVATSFLKNNGSFVGFLNFLLGIRGIREEAGATTTVYAASSPDMVGVTGKYLVKKQVVNSSKHSYDESKAAGLWELSASLTGIPVETRFPALALR